MNLFTKQNILKHTKILLILMIFHFVGTTFIKFQLGKDIGLNFLNSEIINLWKDIYLIFIYFLIIGYYFKNKTKIDKKIFLGFSILFIVSCIISLVHFYNFKTLIIGIKYDIWFLLPLLAFSLIDVSKKDINKIYNLLISLIKLVIILSLIFAVIRFTYPNILFLLGYGPLGDWKIGTYPPVFYQTGLDGIQRLSGIFSGPNHMAFYFIAFGPVILLSILNKKIHIFWGILFIFLLFGTLSRSGILAFIVEFFLLSLFVLKYYKQYRKLIYCFYTGLVILIVIGGTYLYISGKYHQIILRGASTAGHIQKSLSTINQITQNPILGHGLGTAGPAAHYVKNKIIPESWFLQIFYELGLIGGFIWFSFLIYNIYLIYKDRKITYNEMNKASILQVGLSIGIIGLLAQGLVLHSFEDSMVSLPLFIIIGLLLGYKIQRGYIKSKQ